MAVEITPDGAFPELFSEYVDYKRNLGYVYPKSRLYLVRRLSRFLAGRAADERVLDRVRPKRSSGPTTESPAAPPRAGEGSPASSPCSCGGKESRHGYCRNSRSRAKPALSFPGSSPLMRCSG